MQKCLIYLFNNYQIFISFILGYTIEEFADIAILLNTIMLRKPKEALNTVRQKYSHELFFESAKKPFISDLKKLFETTEYKLKEQQIQTMTIMLTASSSSSTSKTVVQTSV